MAKRSTTQRSNFSLLYATLHWLRLVTIGLLVGVSCLAITAFTAVHWVERQFLNGENWVEFVTPLPKQPVIYTALGTYFTNQLFKAVPVEQRISDALPPRASFLAQPLTDQLQNLTEKTAQKVVASDGFQTVWVGANQLAINRLVTAARSDAPQTKTIKIGNQQFDLNLSSVSSLLQQKLGDASPGVFGDNQNVNKALAIHANLQTSRQKIHTAIRLFDRIHVVLPFLALACLLVALGMSRARRRIVLYFSSGVILLAFLQLIGVKALRPGVLNQIHQSSFRPAVGYIYDQLVATFNHMAIMALLLGAVLVIICLLAGPAKWAQTVRSFVRLQKVVASKPMQWWRTGRQWLSANKYYVWIGLFVLSLAYLAFIATVTSKVVVNTLLSLIILGATTYILGTPPAKKPLRAKKS